jgi:ribosome-binding protein aMBF1 (putative translation factor)
MKAKTGAERYFARRLKDPAYAEAHQRAAVTIGAIDHLVRALDLAREQQQLSKAELARRIGVDPAAVRRFFSTGHPNPTAQWVMQLALALGYRINLERDDSWSDVSDRHRETVGV